MALKQVLSIYDMMDDPRVTAEDFKALLEKTQATDCKIEIVNIPYEAPEDTSQCCGFIRIFIRGKNGKHAGKNRPTLGIIGRLGAQGAQPSRIGQVSDADGSTVALATALKLLELQAKGVQLEGDVIITTHVATSVSITPHDPVDFMGMPVSSDTMNRLEVVDEMDAILSVDTSKGNSIVKLRGIALSATAKEGYILRVAPDLVNIMELTTGRAAVTFPITTQDITPYDNGTYHFNSIMQPHVASNAPVVGLAITAGSIVPGCETGSSYENELADATRFAVQLAKQFTGQKAIFYDEDEFALLRSKYGDLNILQTNPVAK